VLLDFFDNHTHIDAEKNTSFEIGELSDVFYLTGLTGYFFGCPDESHKSQSPSANVI
jgi:hypothetical protein